MQTSALHAAVRAGNHKIVELLVDARTSSLRDRVRPGVARAVQSLGLIAHATPERRNGAYASRTSQQRGGRTSAGGYAGSEPRGSDKGKGKVLEAPRRNNSLVCLCRMIR